MKWVVMQRLGFVAQGCINVKQFIVIHTYIHTSVLFQALGPHTHNTHNTHTKKHIKHMKHINQTNKKLKVTIKSSKMTYYLIM